MISKVLKPSFTGKESQTLVLATISPAAKDTEHTVNTLRHACVMDGRYVRPGATGHWPMARGQWPSLTISHHLWSSLMIASNLLPISSHSPPTLLPISAPSFSSPTEDGKAWISGGESVKQDIGEIDVKASKAKLQREEGKRRPSSGNTNSGGGGDSSGGFGYGGGAGDGVGAEAAAAMAARKEEVRITSDTPISRFSTTSTDLARSSPIFSDLP